MLMSPPALIIVTWAASLVVALVFLARKHKPLAWTKLVKVFDRGVSASLVAINTANKFKSVTTNDQSLKTKSGNNSPKSKQVHFADVIAVSSTNQQLNAPNKKASANRMSHDVKVPPIETNNNNTSHQLDSEPPDDELDSSVLLEVFNSTKPKKNKQAQRQTKTNNAHTNNNNSRKRHSSDSNQSSYSSEHLFKLIAASSLSRDEVEMAVETLLNKQESGETDWQKPKNDPLLRLKNQLRDSEAALTTEMQNHEQTRARLVEIKNQLQNERSTKNSLTEELNRIKKELLTTNLSLERTHSELTKHRTMQEKTLNESSKVLSRLEEENNRLQSMLANTNIHHDELNKLRHEFNENIEQLHRYEAANESLKSRLHEMESSLRNADARLDQMRADKQQDDYEACAKISELESDRVALEKALKDHMLRSNKLSETNQMLETSLNESRLTCAHKDEMIKRLKEEEHINGAAMKRTLFEMEQELRELHESLSNRTSSHDEKFRQELNRFEHELSNAGERELKLKTRMKQLREGLSELFPELRADVTDNSNSEDWVHHYLMALRQLTATVNELRRSGDRDKLVTENGNGHTPDSPGKRSVKSNLSSSSANGKMQRVVSPVSNGRSSRASSNRDRDKRLMETKLVEYAESPTGKSKLAIPLPHQNERRRAEIRPAPYNQRNQRQFEIR